MAGLSAEQWVQVKELFARAAELPPEQRRAFLESECPDAEVREEAASLVEHAGDGLATVGQAIASMAAATPEEPDPDDWLIGARLGPYRVEAIVGHGGMGAVYRAERDDAEFRQQVAIKLVRAAAASPGALQRFKRERQILARLSHPNIARLLDGGSTPEGIPYLVMEFIQGDPVMAWCEAHSLRLEDRLRLLVQVCEAVDYAHRSLIVHRDLKPANILVTSDGTPKLLDFGIAKLLDPEAGSETVTKTGWLPMTPDYASPEQVRGEPVTPAADAYALGLILYEMLTGQKAQQIPEYSPATIAQVVCHAEPPPPAALRPQLAGDLDSIIRMALRKEPERRYPSAGELGYDLQRHLDGLRVAARPDTLGYRFSKFVRRNRAAVAAGVVVLASLAGGLVFSAAARLGAEKRLPRVLQVNQLTQIGRVEYAGVFSSHERVYFTERKGGSWSLAQVSTNGGVPEPLAGAQSLVRPSILNISPDGRSLLVGALMGVPNDEPLWVVPTTGGAPRRLGNAQGHGGTWSRDGHTIIFVRDCTFYRINNDGADCRKLFDVPCLPNTLRQSPSTNADLLRFSITTPNMKSVALWEVDKRGQGLKPVAGVPHSDAGAPDGERVGAWTPAGDYFLFQSSRGNVASIWAIREGRSLLPSFERGPVQIYSTPMDFDSLAVSPGDKRIFIGAGQERRELMRYDRRAQRFVPYLPGVAARWANPSPDGHWVAYVTYPDGALWRSRANGSDALPLTPRSVHVVSLPRWSPDGTRIVFGAWQTGHPQMAYVVEPSGGAPQSIPSTAYIEGSPSWSPDGRSLAYGCLPYANGPARWGVYVMDWATRSSRFLPGAENDHMEQPVWSPDGRYLAAHKTRRQLLLFDLRTERWTPVADAAGFGLPFWSEDGKYIFYQDYLEGPEQSIFRVHVRSGKVQRVLGLQQIPQSNVTGFLLGGMGAGDAPIASVIRYNSDIYSLEVELP